jgi:hypothetical protein
MMSSSCADTKTHTPSDVMRFTHTSLASAEDFTKSPVCEDDESKPIQNRLSKFFKRIDSLERLLLGGPDHTPQLYTEVFGKCRLGTNAKIMLAYARSRVLAQNEHGRVYRDDYFEDGY